MSTVMSLGRWIAGSVTEKLRKTWSPQVLAALGSFPDFPDAAELRKDYGRDVPRESTD